MSSNCAAFDEDGDHPEAIKCMMHFFYHAEYTLRKSQSQEMYLVIHSFVYAIADKYDIPTLKDEAIHRFKTTFEQYPFWHDRDDRELLAFVRAIAIAYASVPASDKRLKTVIAELIIERIELIERPQIVHLLQTIPDFFPDLLLSTFNEGFRAVYQDCERDSSLPGVRSQWAGSLGV